MNRLQRGINFERQRLVVKVQGVRVCADAGVGVLGGVVIGLSSFGIAVVWHDSCEPLLEY